MPPGVDTDKLTFVESLCAAAVTKRYGHTEVGCRSCAPFDADGAGPDGQIATTGPFHALVDVYRGSFSGPKREQAALVFERCTGPEASSPGFVLVEKSKKGWHWYRVGYSQDLDADRCVLVPLSDHDVLACTSSVHGGVQAASMIYTYDFKQQAVSTVADMYFDASGVCEMPPQGLIDSGSVDTLEASDVDGDGDVDVRLHMTYGSAKVTPALLTTIGVLCKAKPKHGGMRIVDPSSFLKLGKVALEFLQQGDKLVASPETAKWLKDRKSP